MLMFDYSSDRSCSVTVITGDFESLNPGSIPGRTFAPVVQ